MAGYSGGIGAEWRIKTLRLASAQQKMTAMKDCSLGVNLHSGVLSHLKMRRDTPSSGSGSRRRFASP